MYISLTKCFHTIYASCMEYLPTFGIIWVILKVNMGKYSIYGAHMSKYRVLVFFYVSEALTIVDHAVDINMRSSKSPVWLHPHASVNQVRCPDLANKTALPNEHLIKFSNNIYIYYEFQKQDYLRLHPDASPTQKLVRQLFIYESKF